jgi:pyruvate carboxylase
VDYDPILGKLVTWAETRELALARMERALKENVVLGVQTNTEYLLDILAHPAFGVGATHTGFLDEHFGGWAPSTDAAEQAALAYAAADLVGVGAAAGGHPGLGVGAGAGGSRDALPSPWQTLRGFDSAHGGPAPATPADRSD